MGAGLDLSGLERFKASALLSEPDAHGTPLEIDLDLIDFDAAQPRRRLDEHKLSELAASIRAIGVLEPVSLRTHPTVPGRYVVNRGERRVRASRLAGKRTVPAFLDERIDPYAQAIENLHREDLSPFDLASFIAEREREGDSRAAIARRLHKPASFITEVAGLIDAPDSVRAAFEAGRTRDTRVLYQLAKAARGSDGKVVPLLTKSGPIARSDLESTTGRARGWRPASDEAAGRTVQATKQADALLIEHAGRRGRLACVGWSGKRTGEVRFEDGTRQVLELADLKLIAWTAR